MRFNNRARLNPGRVRDVGGSGGGGRGRLPMSGGLRAGGGIGGAIVVILAYLILSKLGGGGDLGDVLSGSAFSPGSVGLGANGTSQFDYSSCKTGEDANKSDECALVAVENSLTDYWSQQRGVRSVFRPEAAIDVFHGSVSTGGCGTASTDAGPFYCPGDQTIYLDTAFYDTIFNQLGGDATPFVRAYVIAHEYGHHIQDLLGTMNRVKTQQGPQSDSVRLELQADCYAGMWSAHATTVPDADGNILIEDLTASDIDQAIGAAKDVGDDYIQKATGGSVDQDQWTHGSSAERMAWFKQGMSAGDSIEACDTFSSNDLTRP